MLSPALNILSAIMALLAAYFWWASALVAAPKSLGWATIAPDNAEELKAPGVVWAEKVSARNKWGAGFAGAAAFFSALATLSSIDWGFLK